MCHYQIAHCQLGEAVSAVMKLGTSKLFGQKTSQQPANDVLLRPLLFFRDPRFRPSRRSPGLRDPSNMPQIDSDDPPELVSRVSRVSAEPIAAPARARTVEDEAPMDGPETETDAPKVNWVFYDYVPEVLHSLESNSAPVVANLHISHMHIRRRAAPPRHHRAVAPATPGKARRGSVV